MTERRWHKSQMGPQEFEHPDRELLHALFNINRAGTTLHEIAEGAQVSLTTLNRVLDGESCMVATREKLQAYVERARV
jgi:hypothetical protein